MGKDHVQLFEDAHRWRLLVPEVARELGITCDELLRAGGRADGKKRVAAEVNARMKRLTKKTKNVVTYHSLWRFCRRQPDLLRAYFDGNPPSPEEQRKAAGVAGGRREKRARRPGPRHTFQAGMRLDHAINDYADDIAATAAALQEMAASLRLIAQQVAQVQTTLSKVHIL
jgi:hypothetical protein